MVTGQVVRRVRARLTTLVAAVLVVSSAGLSLNAVPASPETPAPPARAAKAVVGAPGVGDSYFPLDGNGGYDVRHYDVRVRYDFARRRLVGRTVLTLVPEVRLRRFNLDLLLRATSVRIDGR